MKAFLLILAVLISTNARALDIKNVPGNGNLLTAQNVVWPTMPTDEVRGFLMTIDVSNTGDDEFEIRPQTVSYNNDVATWDYNVDWGDGSADDFTLNTTRNHAYSPAHPSYPVFQIEISGKFPGFRYYGSADVGKIESIDNWGIDFGDYHARAWYGCLNMQVLATDVPKWNAVQGNSLAKDIYFMFYQTKISSVPSTWDLSWANNMANSFAVCSSLTDWGVTDLSSATTMQNAFVGVSVVDWPLLDVSSCNNFNRTWFSGGASPIETFAGLTLGAVFPTSQMFSETWSAQSGARGSMTSVGIIDFSPLLSPLVFPMQQTWFGQDDLLAFPAMDFSKWGALLRTWENCNSMTDWAGTDVENVVISRRTFLGCSSLKTLSGNPVFTKATDMNQFLDGVTLNTADWDLLLSNMATYNLETSGALILSGGSSLHSAAGATSISTLQGRGWTITDGGLAP